MTTKVGDLFRWVLTIVVLGVMIWWLNYTWNTSGTTPMEGADGNFVDQFTRVKDTLVGVVLPLVTLTLGYWFGVKGADQAKENATAATEQTKVATEQAKVATDTAKAAEAKVGLLSGLVPPADYAAAVEKFPGILDPTR